MIAAVVLLWLLGSQRSVLGALAGGFVGTVAAAGLVQATQHGELAHLHTPAGLVTDLLPLAAIVLVLALVGSYAAFAAAVAWTIGAVAAAITAIPAGQAIYLAPLVLNVLAASGIVYIAGRHIGRRAPS